MFARGGFNECFAVCVKIFALLYCCSQRIQWELIMQITFFQAGTLDAQTINKKNRLNRTRTHKSRQNWIQWHKALCLTLKRRKIMKIKRKSRTCIFLNKAKGVRGRQRQRERGEKWLVYAVDSSHLLFVALVSSSFAIDVGGCLKLED